MMKKISTTLLWLGLLLAPVFVLAKEPVNLSVAKQAVIQYHDSGEYDRDVARVINQAMTYLKARLANPKTLGDHPAILLDIDETSLSNYDNMKQEDFGGSLKQIYADIDKADDAVIAPTLKLYQFAKAHDIAVIFLTGRDEYERETTTKNLMAAGYNNWDELILRSDEYKGVPAAVYKPAMRKELTAKGYHILLNIGDQQSDLSGGYADKTFKLPNPYYFLK